MPPHLETTGFAPTSIQVSESENGCGPALQRPWNAIAMGLPGWSMLPEENFIGEPMACMNAPAMAEPAGYGNE